VHNRQAIHQFARVAVIEFLCVALMIGVYAVIGRLTNKVLLGAAAGYLVTIGNFLALSISVSRAADMAEQTGESGKAQMLVRASATGRLLVVGAILFIVLKAGLCDPLASLLPLLFVKPGLMIVEYFRKDDGKTV